MESLLNAIVWETVGVFYEASVYLLIGFFVAGLLHVYLPANLIARHLGRNDMRSVGLAALFGAPIPLCSCGVLPAAASLKRQGAGRAPLVSFLISTPETGVDSVALTYGLMGPVMAVVRPVVAVVTALVAGIASIGVREDETAPGASAEAAGADACADPACDDAGAPGVGQDTCDDTRAPGAVPPSQGHRFFHSLEYGFTSVLDDIALSLLVGMLLTGVLAGLLPDNFFDEVLGWGSGIMPMLAMIVLGLPLYLCAAASTPVAAALMVKGLSPGAALVFLLVGPATNLATMAVVGRLLGRRLLGVYLGAIILVSLMAGLLVDATLADSIQVASFGDVGRDTDTVFVLKAMSAVGLVLLLLRSFVRKGYRTVWRDAAEQLLQTGRALKAFRPGNLLRGPVLAAAVAIGAVASVPAFTLMVEPGQRGIIQRFGRVVAADLEPGLYFHLPAPFGRGTAVDVALVRQVSVGFRGRVNGARRVVDEQAFYLTADANVIDIRAVVQYRVRDPAVYALGVEETPAVVLGLARRELVALLSRKPIDRIYTVDRRGTERELRDRLAGRLASLGLGSEILDVRLLDVHAPGRVHDAFRDVASALEDRQRDVHVATGAATQSTTAATGEAERITQRAEGRAVREMRRAEGRSAAFRDTAAVHQASPGVTEARLYLETLERSLELPRKYIYMPEAGGGGDVDLWVGAPSSDFLNLGAPVPPGGNR
ncbi:MAG: SO_0444 family Cu/Zn efflux transporter [Deltaproteobacteria bacterium]|nr:SO_0444 family Cu/Zn efflux transporter [Deltaproteobacteria bacterium]